MANVIEEKCEKILKQLLSPLLNNPYVKLLEELGVGHQTKFSSDKSMNVAADIVQVAKELETEFIVMGKKRTRQEVLLGSISDHVAARTRSSLIICKDIAFE